MYNVPVVRFLHILMHSSRNVLVTLRNYNTKKNYVGVGTKRYNAIVCVLC